MSEAYLDADEDLLRWEQAELDELVRHIIGAYHRHERLELARLEALAEEAVLLEARHMPVLTQLRAHLKHLATDLRQHFAIEEQRLFPALLAAASGDPVAAEALDPPSILEAEHLAVEELLVNLRTLTGDCAPPSRARAAVRQLYAGLRDLEDHLHRHIHLENRVLFPRAFAAIGGQRRPGDS